ncbi:MAG: hypothetical protein LC713_03770 [Actinobacteria bacterium]|nr:hypothetical protein [Actinomycetota bacterium]
MAEICRRLEGIPLAIELAARASMCCLPRRSSTSSRSASGSFARGYIQGGATVGFGT